MVRGGTLAANVGYLCFYVVVVVVVVVLVTVSQGVCGGIRLNLVPSQGGPRSDSKEKQKECFHLEGVEEETGRDAMSWDEGHGGAMRRGGKKANSTDDLVAQIRSHSCKCRSRHNGCQSSGWKAIKVLCDFVWHVHSGLDSPDGPGMKVGRASPTGFALWLESFN